VAPNGFRGHTLGVCRLLATAVSRAVAPRRWIACGFRARTEPTARVSRVEFFPSHTDLSHALKAWRAITSSGRSRTVAGRPSSKKHEAGPEMHRAAGRDSWLLPSA